MSEPINICLLCTQPRDNGFGEFLTSGKYGFHYLCLLLSPALYQKASEDNGLYGFERQDVVKEQKRICRQKCCYCLKIHANLSCVIKACRRSFHVKCGFERGCQYHMTDFEAFCPAHRKFEKPQVHAEDFICVICCEPMKKFHYNESIYVDCCKENWFHYKCVTRMAETAGYFFRCPLCQNNDKFREQVMEQGVFVPERDAAWELEPNAFAEQLERPNRCNARRCKCSVGRGYAPKDGPVWKMVLCQACGGKSIHQPCLGSLPYYICDTCSEMGAHSLLDDCLQSFAESIEPEETNKPQTPPCTVNLHDIVRNIHKVTRKPQNYRSGHWIRLSTVTRTVELNLTVPTPPQVTTTTSPSEIVRVPLSPMPVRTKARKRPRDKESFQKEKPSKILKSCENHSIRSTSTQTTLSPSLTSSKGLQDENRSSAILVNIPPKVKREISDEKITDPKGRILKQMTLDSFFSRKTSNNQ